MNCCIGRFSLPELGGQPLDKFVLFRPGEPLNPSTQSFHAPFEVLAFAIVRAEVLHIVQLFWNTIVSPKPLLANAVVCLGRKPDGMPSLKPRLVECGRVSRDRHE